MPQTARIMPDQTLLRECFDYDPETGVLRWRVRPRAHFTTDRDWKIWNTQHAGDEPQATSGRKRYRRCDIGKKRYYLHRIIWKWMTGEEPKGEIDHANGDHYDNRWRNLREATRQENSWNMQRHINKATLKGAITSPTKDKWRSQIGVGGKRIYLGQFATEQEAHDAYVAAAKRLFGEFWRAE